MLKEIKKELDKVKALKKLMPTNEDKVGEYCTENGINVVHYHKSLLLSTCGVVYGAAINIGSVIKGNRYAIVVDDNFYNLDINTRHFIIMHELGHINNGDLPKVQNIIKNNARAKQALKNGKPTVVRTIEIEEAADAYAAKHMGTEHVIEALTVIYNRYPYSDASVRIEALGGTVSNPLKDAIKTVATSVEPISLDSLDSSEDSSEKDNAVWEEFNKESLELQKESEERQKEMKQLQECLDESFKEMVNNMPDFDSLIQQVEETKEGLNNIIKHITEEEDD